MRRSVRLLRRLVVLLALGAPATASSATYYVVQSSPDAWTVMDPQGIESIPGGVRRKAWSVRVQRNILTGDPPQPGYVRTLSEYDCDQTLSRWREFSAFSRSGATLVSKRNPNPEWGPASEAPDTYSAFKIVCQGEGGASVVSAESLAKVVISLMASWDPPIQPPKSTPSVTANPLPKSATSPVLPKSSATASSRTKPQAVKTPVAVKPRTP